MAHLDENLLLDFVEGRLPAEAAREVDHHLDGCASCRQIAAELVRETAVGRRPTTGPTLAPADFSKGATLDRFHIVQKLGAGAMGVVYAAYDPVLDRRCALKVLRPELGAVGGELHPQERLVREARALARLNHPNVVAVHEVGAAEGHSFVVMELVEGETLTAWLKREPRSWREVVRAFVAAAQGLAAAHSLGLVHRDFKPDNVLVGRDGRIRVSDFGLARVGEVPDEPGAAAAPVGAGDLTRTGALLGTPAYMAPEVLEGRGATAQSDQFSLCVALAEALCGARPFEGQSLSQLRDAQRAGWRPPKRLPKRLVAIVARGLSEEPSARFDTVEALASELGKAASPPRRAPAVAAAAFVVALLVGGGFAAHRATVCAGAAEELAPVWGPAQKEAVRSALRGAGLPYADASLAILEGRLDAYAARWTAAQTGACRAAKLDGEESLAVLAVREACLDARRAELGALVQVLSSADKPTAERAAHALNALGDVAQCTGAPELLRPARATAASNDRSAFDAVVEQISTARVLHEAGQYARGQKVAQGAVDGARALKNHALEADALEVLGILQQRGGDAKAAAATLLDAVLAAEAADQDQLAALAWIRLINARGAGLADTAGALEADAHARALIGRLRDDELEAHRLYNLGAAKFVAAELAEARSHYEAALKIRERIHAGPHASVVAALVGIADASFKMGKLKDAIPMYERAAEQMAALLGREHPEVANILHNLGTALAYTQQTARATEVLTDVIALRARTLGPEDSSLCNTHSALAVAHAYAKDYGASARSFRRALEICERSLGEDHPTTARTLGNLAEMLLLARRADEALPVYRRSLAIREARLGKDHPDLAYALSGLGEALRLTGHSREAIPHHERALRVGDRADRSPTERAKLRLRLAQALSDVDPASSRARNVAREAQALIPAPSTPEQQELSAELSKVLASAR